MAISFCAFTGDKAFAVQPQEASVDGESENIENLTANIDDPTTAFINLDAQARQELNDFQLDNGTNDQLAEQIIDYASKYLGRPYRRGAKGPSSFDCSGFTSYIFRNFDIALSPSSRDQYLQGESISTDDIRPGDLLFFAGRRGGKTVGHVAMAVDVDDNGKVKFIHAATSGGIRHDTWPDGGYYSKRFIGARRVLGNE